MRPTRGPARGSALRSGRPPVLSCPDRGANRIIAGPPALLLVLAVLAVWVPEAGGVPGTQGGDVVERGKGAVSSGGATLSTGGTYTLSGTVGQPDDGAGPLVGGTFSLQGGIWPAGQAGVWIFGDGFESGDLVAWDAVTGGGP